MGAGIRLLEEGLRQDLFPPRAGLGVHDRVEEGFEVRVEVPRDVDDLLPWRRERRGYRGRIHLSGHAGKPILGASGTGELEPERIPGSQRLRLSHPQSRPQALALRDEATEKTQTRAAARALGQSHKQSLLQTPTPRKEAGRKWSC